jgi:kynurenine formamidase
MVDEINPYGATDELGALNLLTRERVAAALAAPRRGQVLSLAHVIDRDAPVTPRKHPTWHTTSIRESASGCSAADDVLVMHSHSGTHLDALSHYWHGDSLYNGWPASSVTSEGAERLSIHQVEGMVARCVLLDLSSVCPVGPAGHGFEVMPEHLLAALAEAGTELVEGDAVLLRTGWSRLLPEDRGTYTWGEPGIGIAAARYLADHGVVLVGADTWGVEAVPPAEKGKGLEVHRHLLQERGVYLLENLLLDHALDVAGPGAYLLVIAPLRVRGGVGSPVNPLLVV